MIKKGFLLLFFWTFLLKAQEPVDWVTDFKQLSDTEYLLIFKASMQPKWHLYSQKLPKDGPLPTEFVFEGAGSAFELVGITKESETVTAFDPIFGMDLSWFEKEAAFQQEIRLLQPQVAAISGEINFQACDDKVCIFRNVPFSFILDSSKALAEVKKKCRSRKFKKI